jgi:hypothetical protein
MGSSANFIMVMRSPQVQIGASTASKIADADLCQSSTQQMDGAMDLGSFSTLELILFLPLNK